MAKSNAVTKLHREPLPESITIDTSSMAQVAMAPNELRELKLETGKSMTELMGEDADDADRLQAMVWLRLRRDGHRPSWEDAGDVLVVYATEEPDPTPAASSPAPPTSAGTGG